MDAQLHELIANAAGDEAAQTGHPAPREALDRDRLSERKLFDA